MVLLYSRGYSMYYISVVFTYLCILTSFIYLRMSTKVFICRESA